MRNYPMSLCLLLPVLAAGCGYKGPSLDGQPGLQYQIESYYEDRAWEENATCLSPEMDVTQAEILEDTPEQLVMRVRYYYADHGFGDGDDGLISPAFRCRGFSERTFTMQRRTDGTLSVASMSGAQRS